MLSLLCALLTDIKRWNNMARSCKCLSKSSIPLDQTAFKRYKPVMKPNNSSVKCEYTNYYNTTNRSKYQITVIHSCDALLQTTIVYSSTNRKMDNNASNVQPNLNNLFQDLAKSDSQGISLLL